MFILIILIKFFIKKINKDIFIKKFKKKSKIKIILINDKIS